MVDFSPQWKDPMDHWLFQTHLISQQGKLAAAGSIVVIKHSGFAAAVWATQFTESAWRCRAAVARRHTGQGGRHRDGGHGNAGPAWHRRLVVIREWRGETGGRKGDKLALMPTWSRAGWLWVLSWNQSVISPSEQKINLTYLEPHLWLNFVSISQQHIMLSYYLTKG